MIVSIDFSKAISKPKSSRGSTCEYHSRENPHCARESQSRSRNTRGGTPNNCSNKYVETEFGDEFLEPFGEIYVEDDI